MSADGDAKAGAASTSARKVAQAVGIELIGTGQVGAAFLRRLAAFDAGDIVTVGDGASIPFGPRNVPVLRVTSIANSRGRFEPSEGLSPLRMIEAVATRPLSTAPAERNGRRRGEIRIVVDATASDDVAARHATWLADGLHVVTANKLGQGAALSRWRAIEQASRGSGARYGNSATVGAGLPFVRTIESLRTGGDRIVSLAGVLSGTLAWLFDRYDGSTSFSDCVREAQRLGYTEPDPWQDIAGHDVVRKLLILARTAGQAIDVDDIAHTPLVSAARTGDWEAIDRGVCALHARALADGRVLRCVARLDEDGRASVGLESLDYDHPLAARGSDNRLVIASCRYRERPMTLQGPGAGAEVTAAALLDDVLTIAARRKD